jgi:hypothetical protein
MMAEGIPANRIAWTLRVHERTAEKWRGGVFGKAIR